ncbi:DUF6296 family protein [Kitasatospora sp. NPDC001159]
MPEVQRYAVTLPTEGGSHAPQRIVVVHWTPDLADGQPVYTDVDAVVRVAIDSAHGTARLLAAQPGSQAHCLQAVPLP